MAQRDAKAKRSAKKHIHGLPFTIAESKNSASQWWAVKSTGNWQADLDIGRDYARAFLPWVSTNAGPSMFGWIVDGMARTADPQRGSTRVISGIASGFLMEIIGLLQESATALQVACRAVEKPKSLLAADFKLRMDNGTLFHAPTWRMLEIHRPIAGIQNCWHGVAVSGVQQFEWVYWPAKNKIGRIQVKRFVVEPHQPICTGVWVKEANVPTELYQDVARAVMFAQESLA